MPVFTLNTNVPSDKVPADFLKTTSALIAQMLEKPEKYVCIHLHPNQTRDMMYGGTMEPCGYGSLVSIGSLGPEKNKSHAEKLFKHIHDTLGISPERLSIRFEDVTPSDIAWNGKTF